MKTKVRKSNRSKKAAKVRRSSSAADALVRPDHFIEVGAVTPLYYWDGIECLLWQLQASKEWTKLGRQWKLSDLFTLLSLGLEPDHVAPKVNRRKRKAGFTESAALPVADAVGGEHPATPWVTRTQFSQFIDNSMMLNGRYRRLLATLFTAQSELEARVAVAESRLDSLLHDQPQVPNIDKSGVAAGGTSGSTAPFYKVSGGLSTDLPRVYDPALAKECAESVPSVPGPLQGEGTAGVPLGQEAGNPYGKLLAMYCPGGLPGPSLNSSSLVPEPPRFSRLVRQCVAQARRVLHAAARAVAEL